MRDMQQRETAPYESTDAGIDWEQAQRATRLLLDAVGEDPNRTGLEETWKRRVPEAFETLTEGSRSAAKPELRTFPSEQEDLVIKTGIPFHSLCEHHLLPFTGEAHVAYRPDGAVVGLSKLIRYVRWQSRQLSVQEELTNDIATGLAEELGSDAVVVELSATHLCETMRGVESETRTTTRRSVGSVTREERSRFEDAIRRESV